MAEVDVSDVKARPYLSSQPTIPWESQRQSTVWRKAPLPPWLQTYGEKSIFRLFLKTKENKIKTLFEN